MRKLEVRQEDGSFASVMLADQDAQKLADAKIVFDCGGGHDLHLTPDMEFCLKDIEMLVIAIARARGEISKIGTK